MHIKIFAEQYTAVDQHDKTLLSEVVRRGADLNKSKGTITGLEKTVEELAEEKILLLDERMQFCLERMYFIAEAEKRINDISNLEKTLEKTTKLRLKDKIRDESAEAALKVAQEEKAKEYEAGSTDAYAHFADELPDLIEKYKHKGWFAALKAVGIDAHKVVLNNGPPPKGKGPEDLPVDFLDLSFGESGHFFLRCSSSRACCWAPFGAHC